MKRTDVQRWDSAQLVGHLFSIIMSCCAAGYSKIGFVWVPPLHTHTHTCWWGWGGGSTFGQFYQSERLLPENNDENKTIFSVTTLLHHWYANADESKQPIEHKKTHKNKNDHLAILLSPGQDMSKKLYHMYFFFLLGGDKTFLFSNSFYHSSYLFFIERPKWFEKWNEWSFGEAVFLIFPNEWIPVSLLLFLVISLLNQRKTYIYLLYKFCLFTSIQLTILHVCFFWRNHLNPEMFEMAKIFQLLMPQ